MSTGPRRALTQRATNQERLGEFNETVILDAIRRQPNGVSRVELSVHTGLSAQAISKIVRRLLDDNMVSETGKTIVGPGKPRTVVQLIPGSRYAIGVHLDPASISVVILDFQGNTIGSERLAMPAVPSPEVAISSITTAITDLVARTAVPADRILGVGVAAPGPIDQDAGAVVGPAQMRGWLSVPLRTALHEATGMPILLDKDATAAAVAELWFGRHDSRSSLGILYLGTGVGFGLIINREVVRGDFDNVGEIGHLYSGQDTPEHFCGRRGCIGPLVDPRNLVQRGIASGVLHSDTEEPDLIRMGQLYQTLGGLARGGEPRAGQIIDEMTAGLGRVIVDIANLLDLDRVIIGGPFWPPVKDRVLSTLRARLRNKLVATAIHQVDVEGSTLGSNIGAIGAACLILDNAFSPRAQTLLVNDKTTTEATAAADARLLAMESAASVAAAAT